MKFKAALKKKDTENWLNDENNVSSRSRQEITFKEVKKLHRFENNLKEIKNPTYRISLRKAKIRGPYTEDTNWKVQNCCVAIPGAHRTCLVCKQKQIKDEQHFLMFCNGYNAFTRSCLIVFHVRLLFLWTLRLTAHDRTKYLLTADNNNRTIYTRKNKTCPK